MNIVPLEVRVRTSTWRTRPSTAEKQEGLVSPVRLLLRHGGGEGRRKLMRMDSTSSEVSKSEFGGFAQGSAGKFAFEKF